MDGNIYLPALIIIAITAIIGVNCSENYDSIPQTENEIFNSLLQNAPSTIINIDGIDVDTVLITAENMLGEKYTSFFAEPVYFDPFKSSIMKLEDTLYVLSKHKILVMNEEGVWQRSVGQEGRGPGEFSSIFNIGGNSKQILTFDHRNQRINIYDTKLNLQNTINKSIGLSMYRKNFALSEKYLYLGISPRSNDTLIAIYKIDDLENSIKTFWPKIIPNAFQAFPYNNIIIDVNKNDEIAIANLGLPYLFLLNSDVNIKHILYFNSLHYNELNNPSTKPFKSSGGNSESSVPGVRSFIKHIQIEDDGTIYFMISNNLYQITEDDNKYYLNNAWHFIFKNPDLNKNLSKGISIGGLIIQDKALYFVSPFQDHVFKVNLN